MAPQSPQGFRRQAEVVLGEDLPDIGELAPVLGLEQEPGVVEAKALRAYETSEHGAGVVILVQEPEQGAPQGFRLIEADNTHLLLDRGSEGEAQPEGQRAATLGLGCKQNGLHALA
jgi:hypothetical protein